MRQFLLGLILLLVPTMAGAQGATKSVLPACTNGTLTTCVPQVAGTVVRMVDGTLTGDCSSSGGSTTKICVYTGSAWTLANDGLVWTGANGETIQNSPDSTIIFTNTGNTPVILMGKDSTGASDFNIDTTGAGTINLGSADVAGLTLDTEGLDIDVDGNNSNTISLENSTTGSVVLDMRDYADTTDDDMAHVALATNCTTASTGAEDCDLTVNATEAGAAATRLLIDGDGNTVFAPEPADGGNGDAQHLIVGIPRIAPFSIDPGKVNTGVTNVDFGDDETPLSEWTATANVTAANDGTIWRKGSASLKLTFGATPADGNGADCALTTGNQNWSDVTDAAFGMWARCDEATDGTMLVLEITDTGAGATEVAIPAIPVADHWTWVEVPIGAVADASKDAISSIAIDLTSAGAAALDNQVCYFDGLWKWDTAYENALGLDVYEEGVFSVMSIVKATGGNRVPKLEVEDTDYFVHYETGNDFLVSITDLSNDVLWGLAALEP